MARGTKARKKRRGRAAGSIGQAPDVPEGILHAPRALSSAIVTLVADGLVVRRPIPVSILLDGEDCLASFLDANISASGDTPQEAFRNLCDILVAKFRLFESLPAKKLGREPARQLAIMREFMAKA